MSSEYTLEAQTRTDLGKGASRRLRRLENKVLGIVYGGKKTPTSITFAIKDIVKLAESEAFFTSLVDLSIDGKTESVVVKDMQRHPAKETIMHIDFMRVDANSKLTMHVPLHFINAETNPGVKLENGIVALTMQDIEISCLPKDLPEFIEVDLGECHAGDHVHLSDLTLPKGVESVALSHGEDHDLQIAAINVKRGGDEDEDEGTPAEASEDSSEGEGEE